MPEDFDGKILVFYNSNQPNSSIVLNRGDNYGMDPMDGKLQIYDFSRNGDSSIDFGNLNITYLSDYSGEWNSDGYYNYNTGHQISPLSVRSIFTTAFLTLTKMVVLILLIYITLLQIQILCTTISSIQISLISLI